MNQQPITTYNGGKNGNGTYQTIINNIPPHKKYAELFVGSGAIYRRLLPAVITILNDIDAAVINTYADTGVILNNTDAAELIRTLSDDGPETFLYLDPPYLTETLSCKRKYYKYTMDKSEHEKMLIESAYNSCLIMISHYENDMYDYYLKGWRKLKFMTTTRNPKLMREECLYMNYPKPTYLHDYRYLGNDFREREQIKLKTERFVNKFKGMDATTRTAILSAILNSVNDFHIPNFI